MAGTPVGKVTGRERVGDDAILTLEIEDSAGPITRQARADIRPRTPFEGPVYIALYPRPAVRTRAGRRRPAPLADPQLRPA